MADITASAHLRATGRYTADTGDHLIRFVKKINQKELLEYAYDYSKKVKSDFKEYTRLRV